MQVYKSVHDNTLRFALYAPIKRVVDDGESPSWTKKLGSGFVARVVESLILHRTQYINIDSPRSTIPNLLIKQGFLGASYISVYDIAKEQINE